ncbi:DUF3179 domain-containing (seleno)protein [Vibrio hangzhouensis]|uniref:DUF3179 domain-containing (seleno)protein n=1 Tax=Vibrio hangzhouensis TaxID=462991 RepID=UPI001C973885|nr:DUF3179 domain-containing (seleno)protein [Vibrio hangzhouensis]MBY6195962.1 DUF3179 domain-containing protein [Vibrio hangzhouensis]
MSKRMNSILDKYGKIIFWLCMIIAQYIGALLFKDLADVSQWFVQSDRETTMWVWYNRNLLAITAVVVVGIMAYLKYTRRDIVGNLTLSVLGLVFAFTFYSGMINPHLMMRDRMSDGHFVSVEEGKKYLRPHESVIVMEVNGKARAHSDKQLLRPHVAGKPASTEQDNVVMTYCGLTNLGMAFIPEIDGKPLDLAPANQLRNNLVMWDRNTDEPVQQLWGQKEQDRNMGNESKMQEWPTFRMPFNRFAEAYPQGEVFVNDYLVEDMRPTFWENPFLAVYDPIMEFIFKQAIAYQSYYDEPVFPTLEYNDHRLPSKEKVWGLNVGDDFVAYTEHFVRLQDQPINTQIGGKDIVISYDAQYESLGFYYNNTKQEIEHINFFGETALGKLDRIETVKAGAYWIIWSDFFPKTDLNRL